MGGGFGLVGCGLVSGMGVVLVFAANAVFLLHFHKPLDLLII